MPLKVVEGTTAGVPTHCPYCALQCAMTLRPRPDGGADVEPRDFPVNGGGLCRKGWTAAELLSSPDRLTTPLMRRTRTAPLEPVSWDAALDRIAAELRRIQDAHGRDAVAVFGGGGLTNEKAYLLGKFARVALGTANIDYNGRFCMSSAAAAANAAFGVDRGLPFPVTDIASAGAVLLVGANVAETMPPFVRHLPGAGDDRGLIVVDPRRSQTARDADLHLQVTPGTDLALANGLLHIAIAEGLIDTDYIAARTTGFDEVRRNVSAYWPERVERITGVPVSEQRAAVRMLAAGRANGGAMVLTARGAEQHSKGVDTVRAFINLALALGLPGRPGSGFGSITGQGNGRGVGRRPGRPARSRTLGAGADRVARHPGRAEGDVRGRQQHRGVGAAGRACRTPAGRARFPRRQRPCAVGDGKARRRGLAGGPVGRGGRHDDQSGRPGAAPPARRRSAAERAHRPGDPGRPRGPARPAGRFRC